MAWFSEAQNALTEDFLHGPDLVIVQPVVEGVLTTL